MAIIQGHIKEMLLNRLLVLEYLEVGEDPIVAVKRVHQFLEGI
jgi:hypothetical protein